jgi:DNA-binding response OmpR family regulator
MSWRPRVLIVARTPALGATLFGWFSEAGYDAALVTSFTAAKAQLQSKPDLLISEIRLAEYNGLHLVSRAQSYGVRSAVIGDVDPVLERDARDMGAAYLHPDFDRDQVLALGLHLTQPGNEERAHARDSAARNLAFVSSADLTPVSVSPAIRDAGQNAARRFS